VGFGLWGGGGGWVGVGGLCLGWVLGLGFVGWVLPFFAGVEHLFIINADSFSLPHVITFPPLARPDPSSERIYFPLLNFSARSFLRPDLPFGKDSRNDACSFFSGLPQSRSLAFSVPPSYDRSARLAGARRFFQPELPVLNPSPLLTVLKKPPPCARAASCHRPFFLVNVAGLPPLWKILSLSLIARHPPFLEV